MLPTQPRRLTPSEQRLAAALDPAIACKLVALRQRRHRRRCPPDTIRRGSQPADRIAKLPPEGASHLLISYIACIPRQRPLTIEIVVGKQGTHAEQYHAADPDQGCGG